MRKTHVLPASPLYNLDKFKVQLPSVPTHFKSERVYNNGVVVCNPTTGTYEMLNQADNKYEYYIETDTLIDLANGKALLCCDFHRDLER